MSNFRSFIIRKKRAFYRILYDRCSPKFFYKSPKTMASLWYAIHEGKLPHLRHPKNFSELMMSLNLKARNDATARALRIRCADKYAVRDYVKEKGLEKQKRIGYNDVMLVGSAYFCVVSMDKFLQVAVEKDGSGSHFAACKLFRIVLFVYKGTWT